MLVRTSKLHRYSLHATDGQIGEVVNVFFDDQTWTVRYFVVETGGWLRRRRVLISPIAVVEVDERRRSVGVDLTRDQIAQSPLVETDMPLSRQMELKYRNYFSWPLYWVDTYLEAYNAGGGPFAARRKEAGARRAQSSEPPLPRTPRGDPHLRSAAKVIGYAIIASGLPAGRLEDLVIDSDGWVIRSLVVHADGAAHGIRAMLTPDLVADINWPMSAIRVRASRREIRTLRVARAVGE